MSCIGCICEHCANSAECFDHCQGEMDEPCFNCDDCIHWDGKTGREMWRDEGHKYKITEYWADRLQSKIKEEMDTIKAELKRKGIEENKGFSTLKGFIEDNIRQLN